MRKRATDDEHEVADREIRRQRASVFQWAGLVFTNLPMIIKFLLLFGVGAGTAVTAPKIYQAYNGDDELDTVGDVHVPTTADMDAQQNRAINEIIEKLKKQDEAIAEAKSHGRGDDTAQNRRLDALEELVQ